MAAHFPEYAWTATGTPPQFPNTQPIMYRRAARLLRNSGYTVTRPGGATYHFNRGLDVLPGIDHVLASPELEITSTKVDRERYGERWTSDHYLVAAEIRRR